MGFIQKRVVTSKAFACVVYLFSVLCVQSLLFTQEMLTPPVFENILHDSVFTPSLIVPSSFDTRLLTHIRDLTPNLGAEVRQSFTLENTKKQENMTEEQKDNAILDVFFNLQSLEGMQYYSHRRKQYREFIIKSYRVHSVKDKEQLPDVMASELEPELIKENDDEIRVYKMNWFREDSSFGSGVLSYHVLYNPKKHEFYIHMQNLQNIRYNNVLPIADPLTMSLGFIIKREHNTYSGYAVAGVKASNIPFRSLRRRVSISLMHRMHAIIEWFQQSLENRQAL